MAAVSSFSMHQSTSGMGLSQINGSNGQPSTSQAPTPVGSLFKRKPIKITFNTRRTSSLLEKEDDAVASTSFVPPQLHAKKSDNATQKNKAASPSQQPLWDRPLAFVSAGTVTQSQQPPSTVPAAQASVSTGNAPPASTPQPLRPMFVSIPPAQTVFYDGEGACECGNKCLKCLLLQDIAKFSYIVNKGPQLPPSTRATGSVH
ncbi:hypothetical protein K523DRAFT_310186 [Schizophyllum commune Tattone D]|nr:hypothetical protein K523DRAFT_310186 [Schizophyllum commune Tattone D]